MLNFKINSLKNDDILGFCDSSYKLIVENSESITDPLFHKILEEFKNNLIKFSEAIAKTKGKEYTILVNKSKKNRDQVWININKKIKYLQEFGDKQKIHHSCAAVRFIEKFGKLNGLSTLNKMSKFKLILEEYYKDNDIIETFTKIDLDEDIKALNKFNSEVERLYNSRMQIKNTYKENNPTKLRKNIISSYNSLFEYIKFFIKNKPQDSLSILYKNLESIKIHYNGLLARRHKNNNVSTNDKND